jgi:hypothetical protein
LFFATNPWRSQLKRRVTNLEVGVSSSSSSFAADIEDEDAVLLLASITISHRDHMRKFPIHKLLP